MFWRVGRPRSLYGWPYAQDRGFDVNGGAGGKDLAVARPSLMSHLWSARLPQTEVTVQEGRLAIKLEKLYAMRLRGLADAFTLQQEDPNTTQLAFEERFALPVDRQWNWRQNRALQRRLREAGYKVLLVSKTLTSVRPAGWISYRGIRYCRLAL